MPCGSPKMICDGLTDSYRKMIQLPDTRPLFAPIDLFPRKKTLDDLPQREFMRRGFKIFTLGALVWDYTDTVLNEAKRLNLPDETKK